MELSFRTRTLRTVCEDESYAAATFGRTIANGLRRRLADLRAARTVADLVAGKPTVGGPNNVELRVSVSEAVRLVCRVNQNNAVDDDTGLTDWNRVHRIQVVNIEEAA